jgi:hypothetical protein
MKKQTAVEWLMEQIVPTISIRLSDTYIKELKDQALAMEKEQIEKAYNESWRLRDKPYLTALQYYNQTFGS